MALLKVFTGLCVLSPFASAQSCNTKSGNIGYVNGMVTAWKLYNSQVAQNAIIAERVANLTADYNAKLAEIAARNQAKVDNVEAEHAAKILEINQKQTTLESEVNNAYTQKESTITSKAELAKQSYEVTFANTLEAYENRVAKMDALVVRVTAKYTSKTNRFNAGETKLLQEQVDRYNAGAAKAVSDATVDTAHKEGRYTLILGRFNRINDAVNGRIHSSHDKSVNDLEATKYDTDSTLAVLDNAGSAGGVEYPANCIVTVDTAIEDVKADKTFNSIWKDFLGIVRSKYTGSEELDDDELFKWYIASKQGGD